MWLIHCISFAKGPNIIFLAVKTQIGGKQFPNHSTTESQKVINIVDSASIDAGEIPPMFDKKYTNLLIETEEQHNGCK